MQLMNFNIIFFRISHELHIYSFDNYNIFWYIFRLFVSYVRIDNIVVKVVTF